MYVNMSFIVILEDYGIVVETKERVDIERYSGVQKVWFCSLRLCGLKKNVSALYLRNGNCNVIELNVIMVKEVMTGC